MRTPARLPVVPALLLAGWLVALLIALSEGNEWGWTSARVLGLFAVAVVLAAAWVVVELRVPVPMIDMHMMRRRGVWTSNVVAGCVGFGMFASFGVPATAAADPARGRLRLRGVDHRVGPAAAALGGGQLPGRVRHRAA